MNLKCIDCDESFHYRKKLSEHYERFHQAPEFTGEGKISLNASDQILLIIKGKDTWGEYIESCIKKKHYKDIESAKRLQKFEADNGVEFIACCDEIYYRFNEAKRENNQLLNPEGEKK